MVSGEGETMVSLNEAAKQYMEKLGWKHVVLQTEEMTS